VLPLISIENGSDCAGDSQRKETSASCAAAEPQNESRAVATKGFLVNFTPDNVVEFDTNGAPVQTFERAYRPGEVEIFVGKQKVPTAGMFSA
jgi:hypothetical protein